MTAPANSSRWLLTSADGRPIPRRQKLFLHVTHLPSTLITVRIQLPSIASTITELIELPRCSPAPLTAPPPRWSPSVASMPPVPVSLLPTITPRVPTPTCRSTLARRVSLLATGPSWPLASLPPSALLVRASLRELHSRHKLTVSFLHHSLPDQEERRVKIKNTEVSAFNICWTASIPRDEVVRGVTIVLYLGCIFPQSWPWAVIHSSLCQSKKKYYTIQLWVSPLSLILRIKAVFL